ncbi:RNA processing exonuclease, beta-lactamase fold, Cft2 family [Frankia canadensis]|uniref:RNA processing exonuclease, beta-lactamase fold, Cft2 family n=1 Tax=Frankia canadensis TaxID=1836972 RepID=A0A2I2KLK7_9ACTN|nr:MBL fold metallo-hydrolase [Frankia canadensis]SNQ46547.1 RNA processing exonuclease, beta-lactamase fold, Cft2 family [Frankia canadensis]SOU53837.1 RNA processing exonuclease, beta-lactamase fold, Cft2 family [Frankia canadensis]
MTSVPGATHDPLPPVVLAALRLAATVIAEVGGEPVDPGRVVASREGVFILLDLLAQSAPLRAEVAARLAATAGEGLLLAEGGAFALGLTDRDPAVVGRAAGQVRALLGEQRRAARRDRREQQRAGRATAEQRRDERAKDRLADLRQARDQARRRAALAESDARRSHAELLDLGDELAAQTARAQAAQAQLAAARREASDPLQLAAALAALLRCTAGAGLDQAARLAGLPAELATTVSTWLPALLDAFADPPAPAAASVSARERQPRVDVLGGGTEIGGSCVLITAGDTRLLVDAGSRPGGHRADDLAPPRIADAFAGRLDAVVVTHAHNDHAGWVPAVLARSPHTPVLATEATATLLAPLWIDSAKVLARRGTGDAFEPAPFDADDVQHALRQLRAVPCGRRHRVGDLDVELFPAGHIVGAAGVVVHAGDQRIVVSGDVSRAGQRTVGGIAVPPSARGARLLLLESTYAGAGRMPPREATAARLVADVAAITSAGGRVLIPAFALGRAQEVALTLTERLPDVDIRIDGLARAVTAVYEQQPGPDGGPMRIFGPRVRAVPPGGTQEAIRTLRAGVVIATSGMLTAGPAVSWARALLPDPSAGLMVVGYQDEDSPGARLLALAEAGGGAFELPTRDGPPSVIPVAARVGHHGLGAHASADDLVTITADIGAAEVMLVHGEPKGQATFAARLALRAQPTAATGAWSS